MEGASAVGEGGEVTMAGPAVESSSGKDPLYDELDDLWGNTLFSQSKRRRRGMLTQMLL